MITLDLNDIFEATEISDDFRQIAFVSTLKDNSEVKVYVQFTKHPDELLENVYNLAFGPLTDDGIDDKIKLCHKNVNKVFSTIIFYALAFLIENKENNYKVGIDGSNETRAYLYHRMFIYNCDLLKEFIITIGVDWYVRLLRNGDVETNPDNCPAFKPRPEPFNIDRLASDLYRYYLIELI